MNDLTQYQQYLPSQSMEMAPGPSTSSSMAPLQQNLQSVAAPAPGPIRRRRFSTAKIQPTRIKKVMQADEEIGRMVASVPVAIGRAMEHFAEKFLQAAAQATANSNSRTLTPVHMKQAMLANPHFHFLDDVLKEVGVPGRPGGAPLIMPSTAVNHDSTTVREHLLLINQPSFIGGMQMQSPVSSPVTPSTPLTPNYALASPSLAALSQMQLPYHPLMSGILPMTQPLASPTVLQKPMSDLSFAPTAVPMEKPVTAKKPNGKRNQDLPEGEKPKRGRPRKIKKDDKCLDDDLCKEVSSGIEKEDKDRALMPPPALPIGLGRAKPVA